MSQSRNNKYPDLCCIEALIDIIQLAAAYGADHPNDPLCVYQKDKGEVEFSTGAMITAYYCSVTKVVFPAISTEELKVIF